MSGDGESIVSREKAEDVVEGTASPTPTPTGDLANMSLAEAATKEAATKANEANGANGTDKDEKDEKDDESTSEGKGGTTPGDKSKEATDEGAGDGDTEMTAAEGGEESKAMDESNAEEADDLTMALGVIGKSKASVVKSCVAALSKNLSNLKKKPKEARYRKMRMDNIIVKKFITSVPGALDFMLACGFAELEEGSKKYLAVDPDKIDFVVLDKALALLGGKKESLAKPAEGPVVEEKRIKCAGGCGFWGDPNTDNYCSLCVRKRVIGGATPAAAAGAPKKCIRECGFFGADKFDGMCSVCWDKESKEKAKTWKAKLKMAEIKLKCVRAFRSAPRLKQANKKRCWQCKRKVGIVGIECRCGYIFCGKHRYADEHDCIFDHKRHQQAKLRKENKQIVTSKIDKLED